MKSKTVRELSGEIWAELTQEINRGEPTPLLSVSIEAMNRIGDIVMGVLARYGQFQILNDWDLPVEPLPREFPREDE